jgi:hypothetical protein
MKLMPKSSEGIILMGTERLPLHCSATCGARVLRGRCTRYLAGAETHWSVYQCTPLCQKVMKNDFIPIHKNLLFHTFEM